MHVRPLTPTDAPRCDEIVASLPGWFGDPTGIRDCREAVRSAPGLVADDDGTVIGFLTAVDTGAHVREITWMAVDATSRRTGVGRALIDALCERARDDRVTRLDVKTLSDRHPDPGYAQTRAFYRSVGFVPVAELEIWGPESPAQLLSMPL